MPRTKEQFEAIRNKTKHKILESALVLFAEKGFKGTSINDIAKSAGISKGLAYNYFKNKNEIMQSVLYLIVEHFEILHKKAEDETDPKKKLKLLINQTFKTLEEDEKFWRIYMNFVLSPEIRDTAEVFMSGFIEDIFKWMERLFKDIGIKNAALESKLFAAALDGICFHYIFDDEKYPLQKMRKFLIGKYCK